MNSLTKIVYKYSDFKKVNTDDSLVYLENSQYSVFAEESFILLYSRQYTILLFFEICFIALQLLVGSDDYEIREFKDDIIVNEISETSSICLLNSFSTGRFSYALDNGTVGVYDKFRRVWRVKVQLIFLNFIEKV